MQELGGGAAEIPEVVDQRPRQGERRSRQKAEWSGPSAGRTRLSCFKEKTMGTPLELEHRDGIATTRTIRSEVALFPVFLNLTDRPVVLVGGGAVADEKPAELRRPARHVS